MTSSRTSLLVLFEEAFRPLVEHLDQELLIERVFVQEDGGPPIALGSVPSVPEVFPFWDTLCGLLRGAKPEDLSEAVLAGAETQWRRMHIQDLPGGQRIRGLTSDGFFFAPPKTLFLELSWEEKNPLNRLDLSAEAE